MTKSERYERRKTDYRRFIASLEARKADYDNQRGAFATLRRGLGFYPTLYAPMHQYVIPYIPVEVEGWEKFAYFFTASLYASYIQPLAGDGMAVESEVTDKKKRVPNLGDHFAEAAQAAESSDSAERHLNALLVAHPDDLHFKLRQTIAYLKSRQETVNINWSQLLSDIADWQHPNSRGRVQDRWATAFYRQLHKTTDKEKST